MLLYKDQQSVNMYLFNLYISYSSFPISSDYIISHACFILAQPLRTSEFLNSYSTRLFLIIFLYQYAFDSL